MSVFMPNIQSQTLAQSCRHLTAACALALAALALAVLALAGPVCTVYRSLGA